RPRLQPLVAPGRACYAQRPARTFHGLLRGRPQAVNRERAPPGPCIRSGCEQAPPPAFRGRSWLISVLTDRRGDALRQESWMYPGVDVERPNAARVYDALLGGTHNFAADRDVARNMTAIEPGLREGANAN